ncbi:MAG: MATE family efflux transporter [Clostridia bacterium]
MKNKSSILNGKLDQIIWIIAFPIILTNMIEGMYGIIDSMFVANVGISAVASVAFVGPIQDTLNAVGLGISIAGCSLIARFIGAKDEKKAKKMIANVFIIGVAIGFLVSFSSYIFSEQILVSAGVTEDLLQDSSVYLKLTSWGIVFTFIIVLYLAIERAQGNTKTAVIINAISISLKIIFCYLFTIWQDFGITGIGFATVFAQGICASVCIFLMLSKKNTRLLKKEEYRLDFSLSKILIITALPLVFEKSLTSYGFVIANKYVLEYGEAVLAAYGLTNKVNTVFFKAVTALGTGLAVIVAQNIGANNIERAKKAVKKTLIYAIILSVAFISFLYPLRYYIASLFVDTSEETYMHMVTAMSIYTASIIPWGITECILGVFQGTGKTKFNLLISLLRIYVFRVPVIIIFCQPFWNLGECAIWYAMLVSNILSAVFSLSLYLIRQKKIIKELE